MNTEHSPQENTLNKISAALNKEQAEKDKGLEEASKSKKSTEINLPSKIKLIIASNNINSWITDLDISMNKIPKLDILRKNYCDLSVLE